MKEDGFVTIRSDDGTLALAGFRENGHIIALFERWQMRQGGYAYVYTDVNAPERLGERLPHLVPGNPSLS